MIYHKGQIVYLSCLAEFEGRSHPAVLPVKISAVLPQRAAPPKYHIHAWDPMQRGRVEVMYRQDAESLFASATEAFRKAVDTVASLPSAEEAASG